MLRGVSNDYIYIIDPFFTPIIPSRRAVRRDNDLSAFMYQNIACSRVREMGFARCTECPLPGCNISTADVVKRIAYV